MKAAIAYCLTVFYFLISIGLTANLHYCGGKFKHVTFAGFQKQKNCCKGKGMKKGCCKDVPVTLKKSSVDERVITASAILSHPIDIPAPAYFSFEAEPLSYFIPEKIVAGMKAPPPQAFPPVIIRNCVFRI